MKKKYIGWKWIFLFFLSQTLFSQNLNVAIKVSPNPASLQSTIVLQISVSGNTQSLPDIPTPDLKDFTIISGPSTSQSIQIINFKMSAVKTLTYQLVPKKTGVFLIGPVKIKYKGKIYQSNRVRLVVQKGATISKKKQNTPVFLKAQIQDKDVYLYQPIPMMYKLYLKGRVRSNSLQLIREPDFAGFWVEDVKKQSQPFYEMVGNKRYEVYPIYEKILFPIKSGTVTIHPMQVSVDLLIKSRRNTDPFGFFDDFDDFFGNYTTRKIVTASDSIVLHVKPLPPVDSDVSPLVGLFKLSVNNKNFIAKTSDAITLRITLEGNGYLGALNNLPIQFPESFEVYEPKIKTTSQFSGGEYHVKKTFEYIIIPRVEGHFRTNEIKIPMFDYVKEKYAWLTIPSFYLQIEKNPNEISSLGTFTGGGTTGLKDIRYIKTTYEQFTDIMNISKIQAKWIILVLINILLAGILLYIRQVVTKTDTDYAYARTRKAKKIAMKRLKEAKKQLEEKQLDAFAEEIYKAITVFISDRLHLENKSLTITEVESVLSGHAIPEELRKQILDILKTTETIRFAPKQILEQAMDELYQAAENVIVQLQKYI